MPTNTEVNTDYQPVIDAYPIISSKNNQAKPEFESPDLINPVDMARRLVNGGSNIYKGKAEERYFMKPPTQEIHNHNPLDNLHNYVSRASPIYNGDV